MKNIIIKCILLSVLLIGVSTNFCGQTPNPRDVLAVPGTYSSSFDWHPEINIMRNHGYQIREVFSPSLFDWNASIVDNYINLDNMVNDDNHDYSDVLGLGHDVGGLALRALKEENSKVTGLILVGTPNRGSNLLRDLQSPPGVNSNLEDWLATLDAWKGGVECKNCDKTKKLLEFIKAFGNENYAQGAINDPNSLYNELENPNPQTTAIIWGNAGEQRLGDFLGSMDGINPLSDIDLEGCHRRLILIKEVKLKEEKLQQKIDRVTGFFSTITAFFSLKLKDKSLSFVEIIKKVGDFITSTANTIMSDILKSNEIDQLERELLICELANQRLDAEWRLRIAAGTGTVKTVPNPNYDPNLPNYIIPQFSGPYSSYASGYVQYLIQTGQWPSNNEPEIRTFVVEPTDLVFTKTEQTHPSVTLEFEIKANHFREQAFVYNGEKLVPLFDGQYGDAFRVPKD